MGTNYYANGNPYGRRDDYKPPTPHNQSTPNSRARTPQSIFSQKCPQSFRCPLSGSVMRNPVLLMESGHTFEEKSILKYLEEGNRKCPLSGADLLNCNYISNVTLREAIEDWAAENGVNLDKESENGSGNGNYVSEADVAYDWVASLLEEQFRGMYRGWDLQDELQSAEGLDGKDGKKMLDEVIKLLYNPDRATNQAAALSLARFCWGSFWAQSHVGGSKYKGTGILQRLVNLLSGEIQEGRPGHIGWALAELCRNHSKNQTRLLRLKDVDIMGLVAKMFHSQSDQWVVRGCRIVGGVCSGNAVMQNLVLDSGLTQYIVDCLKSPSSAQRVHAGMAILHVCHGNRETSMEALKTGALLYVPEGLASKALILRVVSAGIVSHLMSFFDYNWGANYEILNGLVSLLHQVEDYAAFIGAAAIFELVNREKVDMFHLTAVRVAPRVIDLLKSSNYPGFRRTAHRFLTTWAKFASTQGSRNSIVSQATQEVIQKFVDLIPVNSSLNNEIAIHVIFMVLPFSENYKHLIGSLDRFEQISMNATISEGGRSMAASIVSYVRRVEVERKGKMQVIVMTTGVFFGLRAVKLLGKALRRGWFNWL